MLPRGAALRCILYPDVFPIPRDDEPDVVREAAAGWLESNPIIVNRIGGCTMFRSDLKLARACRRCRKECRSDGRTPLPCLRGCGAYFCSEACCSAAQEADDLHRGACIARRSDGIPLVDSIPFAHRMANMDDLLPAIQDLLEVAEFQAVVWACTPCGACYLLPCPLHYLPSYASRALATVLIAALGPKPSKVARDNCDRGFCMAITQHVAENPDRAKRRTAAVEEFERFDRLVRLSPKKYLDLETMLRPKGYPQHNELLLNLCSGGWPGTEMCGEGVEKARRWMQNLEVAGVLKATRAAVADIPVCNLGPQLAAEVWQLFASVVCNFQTSKVALPLQEAADVSAVAVVELLMQGPTFHGGMLQRSTTGIVVTARASAGDVVSFLPVLAVLCTGTPSKCLEYQWHTGDLIVANADVMERKDGAELCCFAVVGDYCRQVFGEKAAFIGERSHVGVEMALLLAEAKMAKPPLELFFYGGIWPCLIAAEDLQKGCVLKPIPGADSPPRPPNTPTQSSPMNSSPAPSSPVLSSTCDGLAASIAEANAKARDERKARRRGGSLSIGRPVALPAMKSIQPSEDNDVRASTNPAQVNKKQYRGKPSSMKRELEKTNRATAAFLKETDEARRREEDRLQSLELLEIEERLRACLLQESRRQSKKPREKRSTSCKIAGPVVAQLFYQSM